MTIGPVQLIVLGFNEPEFRGEILGELDRLKANDVVRVIDALGVYKDADGEVAILERSDLSTEDAQEFGATVGALIGLGAGGEEGMQAGAAAGAEATEDGVEMFSAEDAWDVVGEIPKNSAAALILLEHRWAIPLRDAVIRAGGFPVASSFINPLDLVGVGLLAADDAAALAAAERGA